jgi:hypothetical protein
MFINNTKIRRFLILINGILLVIIILFSPLSYYIFNLNYYEKLYEKNGVFSILDKRDVMEISVEIFDFFKYKRELNYKDHNPGVIYADEGREEILLFTENEISHLYDVRELLKKIFILYYSSLALFIIFLLLLIRKNMADFIHDLGLIFTVSSILMFTSIVFFYLSSKNFPALFDIFHKIFFPGGNYSFYEGSLLITIFPSGFFYDFFIRLVWCSGIISSIVLITGILIIFIYRFIKKKKFSD